MPAIEDALQLAWNAHRQGDVRAAERRYRQVLAQAPANANAWCFLGMACHDQGRQAEAVDAYEHALQIQPEFPVALSNLSNTLNALGRLPEAEARCREALRQQPGYAAAHNNLGTILFAQGRLEEADVSYRRSLELDPRHAAAHANLGAVLLRGARFDEAASRTQRALQLDPGQAEAHQNQAFLSLLHGDLERGWREYEWRWKCSGAPPLPQLAKPRWAGEPLAGRTILLHCEQGLGDTIQFIRYARIFRERGARVVVCCQEPLLALLRRCEGIEELVAHGDPLPEFDCWTPLLSIPGALRTDLDAIPARCGYLTADPVLVARWRRRMDAFPGLRIAVCWQGNPRHPADRQRSFPLERLAPLAALPGARLISLQQDRGTEQIGARAQDFELVQFLDLDRDSGPFMDRAAILRVVDLLITCDTGVAHLAGALGVPVWVALPAAPDWRWLLDREDSPWYPQLRLFRQHTPGDWEPVFERIAAALNRRAAGECPPQRSS